MIIRGILHDPIAISQPTHAWVSGQLARAWGNERFGLVEPWEDVCLGAEQHDLGWTEWERRPTLNPATGLPRRFFELPTGEHVALWHDASQRMLTQSRYAALLVSLHISTLYERHNYVNDSPAEVQVAHDLLAREHAFQDALLDGLRSDPRYAGYATPDAVRRNQRLVAVWDVLSLLLGTGKPVEKLIDDVPTAAENVAVAVTPLSATGERWAIDPWPFREATVSLRYEGRRVPKVPTEDEPAWQLAYAAAQWVSVDVELADR
jgi:hypothetical protein